MTECFLIKKENVQSWELFYDFISGFEYETGFEYKLLVKREVLKNPPMDPPSVTYHVVQLVSKEQKNSENLPRCSRILP